VEIIRRVLRRRERDPYAPIESDEFPTERVGIRARAASVLRPQVVTRYVGVAGDRIRQSPVFAPFSRLTVGLTYEGASLKLVVSEERRVISWETIPFDPRLLNGNLVVEPFNLGRLIRDAFAMRGLPRYRVHCALPAAGALSRVIEIPRLGAQERRRAVISEAMRALGVSPGRHYVYWQVVDEQADSQLVFVLAVPRDAMRSLIETMRTAGIRPRTVDITPLALARAVGQPDAIVLELDPTGIDIAIVLDDVPLVLRSAVFGERALTLEEAQETAIDMLTSELRRYEDVYPGMRVERSVPVFLAGDLGAGLRLADRVRTATGHPIGRLGPMVDYPADFPVGEYLTNLGLVLKEV
jgi:type IV pilus assembly protein PilM